MSRRPHVYRFTKADICAATKRTMGTVKRAMHPRRAGEPPLLVPRDLVSMAEYVARARGWKPPEPSR